MTEIHHEEEVGIAGAVVGTGTGIVTDDESVVGTDVVAVAQAEVEMIERLAKKGTNVTSIGERNGATEGIIDGIPAGIVVFMKGGKVIK